MKFENLFFFWIVVENLAWVLSKRGAGLKFGEFMNEILKFWCFGG